MRAACEELITRERLPSLHRAQLLMFLACTEEDEDVDKIRERIEDAQYWINDVENAMLNAGLQDPRVAQLQQNIAESRSVLTEHEELPSLEQETVESDASLLPSGARGFKKANELKPGDLGSPLTADEKYDMIKNAQQFEREVAAAQAAQVDKTQTQESKVVEAKSTQDVITQYRGPSAGGAEPLIFGAAAPKPATAPLAAPVPEAVPTQTPAPVRRPDRPATSPLSSRLTITPAPAASPIVSGVSATAQPSTPTPTGSRLAVPGAFPRSPTITPTTPPATTPLPLRPSSSTSGQAEQGAPGLKRQTSKVCGSIMLVFRFSAPR